MSEWPPPGATELVWCVSAPPLGRLLLAGFATRTYRMADKRLELADEQRPLVVEPDVVAGEGLAEDEDTLPSWLRDDTDLLAPKVATDVVVAGSGYATEAGEANDIAVAVGRSARRLRVCGPRQVEVDAKGQPRFTAAAPFEAVELGPQSAYGGRDLHAQWTMEEDESGTRLIDLPLASRPRDTGWLYEYVRNPVGRGFFLDVDRHRADGAWLPQVEDPADLLTPSRLFVASPLCWPEAPLSASLGWVHHSWYPRLVRYLGRPPEHEPPPRPPRELSFDDGADLAGEDEALGERVRPRALQGAGPGLAVERLRGDEVALLEGLHPTRRRIEIALPGERPVIVMRPGGTRALQPDVVLQTVRLFPDRELVSLTWTAALPLLGQVDDDFVADTELEVGWRPL